MLIQIPQVLNASQVAESRKLLFEADWVDGKVTAGHQAAKVKDNSQLPEDHPTARKLGEMITKALAQNPLFVSAALPLKVFPPMFNSYKGGQAFGSHVDTAIRQVAGTPHRVRTDLSATLFLTAPEDYEGGELVVEDTFGLHKIKLAAGNLILYPSSSLHHVEPVTRGDRVSSFFWIQSMVRSDEDRTILFDLDNSIQQILRDMPGSKAGTQLTGVYHNLLRKWAEV